MSSPADGGRIRAVERPLDAPGVRAFVGLGANLGVRATACLAAVRALRSQCAGGAVQVAAVSSAWESAPWGDGAQPAYVNAVVALDVLESPVSLLRRLLALEETLGRDRANERRWGPRPIDLDLLLFGAEVHDAPACRVPHPELSRRRFVLEPLAELAPDAVLPDGRRVSALLAACADPLWVRRLGALEDVAAAERAMPSPPGGLGPACVAE